MKKKILCFLCCLLMILPLAVSARTGQEIVDPGELPLWHNFQPTPDTQTSTRYTPWFVNLHHSSDDHVDEERRAGEGGQIVRVMAVSPVDNKRVLVGIDVADLYLSKDGGENFELSSRGLPLLGISDALFDYEDPDTIYILLTSISGSWTSEEKIQSVGYAGIYKTTDFGKSWTQVLDCVQSYQHLDRGMRFDSKGNLYVPAYEGLFVSPDRGKTWQNLGFQNQKVSRFYVDNETGYMLYAVAGVGIYYSEDGVNWELTSQEIDQGAEPAGSYYFDVSPNDNNLIVAIHNNMLYYSYDRGKHWEVEENAAIRGKKDKGLAYVNFGCYNPDGNPVLYVRYSQVTYPLMSSFDLGKSWNTIVPDDTFDLVQGNTGYSAEGLGRDTKDPYVAYYSFNDVVYKTYDGGLNFEYSSTGFSGSRAAKYIFDDPNYGLVITFTDKGLGQSSQPNPLSEGFYTLTYSADSVTPRFSGAKTTVDYDTDPTDPRHVYVTVGSWGSQTLEESWNYGRSFKIVDGIVGGLVHFNRNNPDIIYTSNNTSFDHGKTWEPNSKGISAVSPANNDVLYSADANNKLLFKSKDCGKTWTAVPGGLSVKSLQKVVCSPYDEDTVFALNIGSVEKIVGDQHYNYGVANGLVNYDEKYGSTFAALAFDPDLKDHMLVGGRCSSSGGRSCGVFESYDGGETWELIPEMPGGRDIWAIAFEPGKERAWIATSNGTWLYEFNNYQKYKKEVLENDFKFYINGKENKNIALRPVVKGSEVFVGLNTVLEKLNTDIETDATSNTVIMTHGKSKVKYDITNNQTYLNGKLVDKDFGFYYDENNNLMISFTALRELLGFKTGWNLTEHIIGLSE